MSEIAAFRAGEQETDGPDLALKTEDNGDGTHTLLVALKDTDRALLTSIDINITTLFSLIDGDGLKVKLV